MFLIRTLLLFSAGLVLCQSMMVPEETGIKMDQQLRDPTTLTRYFVLFHGSGTPTPLDPTNIAAVPFVTNENVAILIHGHKGASISEFGMYIAQALVRSDTAMSVILVDWSIVASYEYDVARANLPFLAIGIAKLIEDLKAVSIINKDKFHLIGFDLGAHLAGMTSRIQPAHKITGLDPSRSGWDGIFYSGLSENDADVVEVIHTDGFGNRALGIGEAIGHINIYPNGGTNQPGCSSNACSHERAWEIFEATVTMNGHLWANRCTDINQMSRNRCTGVVVRVGTNYLNKWEKGIYRVNTGRQHPFYST